MKMNPVKIIDSKWKENGIKNRTRAKEYLKEYKYSSYLEYLGYIRDESVLINKVMVEDLFEAQVNFESSVSEWLEFAPE